MNAPAVIKVQQNTYEAAQPVVSAKDTTAGANAASAAHAFEQRVTQESGTH